MKKYLLLLALCVSTLVGKAQTSVTVNPGSRLQTIEGWGVSLCWWAAQAGQWSDEEISQIADWLVSPDGLNYNVFRYNIPAGDDPNNAHCTAHHMQHGKGLRAEMKGFAITEADFTNKTYKWENDEAQIKMMRALIERAKFYGKELKIEAFANSCPWWMTVSGCVGGSEKGGSWAGLIFNEKEQETNLNSAYHDKFAQYLIDVCKHFKEVEGIEFYSLEPFNEPYANNYWKRGVEYKDKYDAAEVKFEYKMGGEQEGCYIKPADQIDFVKNHLAPELEKSGLNTIISVSDETNLKLSKKTWDKYAADSGVMSKFTQWNTHTYDGTNDQRTTLKNAVASGGKKLWMSETGPSDGSGITSNVGLAKKMFDDLRYLQPVVWCDWQAVEANDEWCLIHCSGDNNGYLTPFWRNKNFFVRHQITSNIKVGYSIITTNNDNVLAAVNPEGTEVVACVVNNSDSPTSYTLDLSSWGKGSVKVKKAVIADFSRECNPYNVSSTTNIRIPKQSLVTLIIEPGTPETTVSMVDSEGEPIEFGNKYLMSTTKMVKVKTKKTYPDFLFFAEGTNGVKTQEGWTLAETVGGFLNSKYLWEPQKTTDNKVVLKNMLHGNYLGGGEDNYIPVLSYNSQTAMRFSPEGPYTSGDNTNYYWVLTSTMTDARKYLNWNGASVPNGFCYWSAGSSDEGSKFRFHKVEYAQIRNIYKEVDGERVLDNTIRYKINDDANLVFTGSHEFYHEYNVGGVKMEGAFETIAPADEIEGFQYIKYIVNDEELNTSFKSKYIKHKDVVDLVFVCKGDGKADMTQFVLIDTGDKSLNATNENFSIVNAQDPESADKNTIFLIDKHEDGSKYLLSYGEGLYMRNGTVGTVGKQGSKINFNKDADGSFALKVGLDYLAVKDGKVVTQMTKPDTKFTLTPVLSLPVKLNQINGKGYGTFYTPVAVEIPTGLEAYVATIIDEGMLKLVRITNGVIPPATGVVLYTETSTMNYWLPITTDEDIPQVTSTLRGTYFRRYVGNNKYFGLNAKEGKVGFYPMKSTGILSAFRAYLDGSDSAKAYVVVFDDTDIVEAIEMDHQSDEVYDLQGRRVQNPSKGVYIVNGKKILINK